MTSYFFFSIDDCITSANYKTRSGYPIYNLAAFLASPKVAADLEIDDVELAAEQLKMLCHTDLFLKRMFGLMGPPTQAQIDQVASSAVETFLARYGRGALSQAAE